MTYILLIVSVIFSTVRAIFSKQMGTKDGDNRNFYTLQGICFLVGLVPIALYSLTNLSMPSAQTVILALCYGFTLIMAQWMYTIALKNGSVSITTMIYAFGFIIPTISGTIFWPETEVITPIEVVGIVLVIISTVLSSLSKEKTSSGKPNVKYFAALTLCFLAGGGLGLIQKLQSNSKNPEQIGSFLFIAFAFASATSFIAALISHDASGKIRGRYKNQLPFTLAVGICFSLANILNTYLAGVLPSAYLFPVLNIGCIIATLISAMFLYRERLKNGEKIAFVLGILSIILISLGKII